MKVAFFTYPAAFQNVGGGEILLLKLREYLMKEGVTVDLFDTWSAPIQDYDWLHVFGSVKDCLGLVRVAKKRNVRVAITPLLWSDLRRALFTDGPLRMKADLLARHTMKWLFPAFPSARRELLLQSDLIFPNSEIEKKQIQRLFAVPEPRMRVLPNGVDSGFLNADPAPFREKYGKTPFILGVGRIEPRKNQLNLIKAVQGISGAKLVLIGSPVSGYEKYFQECQSVGGTFTTFIPTLNHEDSLLRSAYAACELFVLQGWFETPGLAALEAALAGAKVLVTQGGSTREYFGDFVDYLDPASPKDMRERIERNLKKPIHPGLKKHVTEHFTWEKVAKACLEFYREAAS